MNRNLIALQIILWAALGVVLVFILVCAVSGAFSGLRFAGWGGLEARHEETVPQAGIERITLDFGSMDVSVMVTDGDDIRIVQLASRQLAPDEHFTLENANGELRIGQGELRRLFGFLSFGARQRVELYLPRSYAQSLSVKTRSGNVTLFSDLALEDVSFQLSSGNLSCAMIDGGRVEVRITSGNIRLDGVSCGQYDINAISGNIDIACLKGAGEIHASSGNITVDLLEGLRHDVQASSGDIRLAGFSGSGSVHTNSGSIRMDCVAVLGDLDLGALSGNVRIKLPEGASYELYASCTSGDINADIDMSYSKNGRTATAKVGSGPYVRIDIETHSGNINVDQKIG